MTIEFLVTNLGGFGALLFLVYFIFKRLMSITDKSFDRVTKALENHMSADISTQKETLKALGQICESLKNQEDRNAERHQAIMREFEFTGRK